MCRIAGIINNSLPLDEISFFVKKMCDILKDGGPDDEGFYVQQNLHFVLGHRRLSIIDLSSAGHQPMMYGDSKYVISYNGEIYNYPELKKELESLGYSFKTQSDTEVILAAYASWGVDALKRLSGMFAFALWDETKQNLVLARDGGGIKPLYYAHTKEGIAFASEIRALKSIPYLNTENSKWPVYLMAYGHIPEPISTLKNIKPLEKGTYLIFNPVNGTCKIESFKRYHFIEKLNDKKNVIDVLKEKADLGIKRHLISNAPIGVFLSGGLDSAIIAKLASRHVNTLNTLSLYFSENEYSEKKYQDILTRDLSGSHHQHLLTEDEFHAYLPDIMGTMDMPCCDGINTWFISKYAREANLKAVLSGIGGDELFGGYPSFRRIKKALALQHLPNLILRSGRFSGSKRLRRLAYLSIPGITGRYLFLRGQFIPGEIAKHLDASEAEVWKILEANHTNTDIDHLSPQNQASWMETNIYMQNQLLRDADVMSMSHGLEIRVPFLDDDFIQFTMKIASGIKYSAGLNKQILIDAFNDILPEQIWNRSKMGFAFPFKEWFSHQRYADSSDNKKIRTYHKKLIKDEIHWSQFFSLLLIQNHNN